MAKKIAFNGGSVEVVVHVSQAVALRNSKEVTNKLIELAEEILIDLEDIIGTQVWYDETFGSFFDAWLRLGQSGDRARVRVYSEDTKELMRAVARVSSRHA